MKVYLGPHVTYFGPYQLAKKLCFFAKKVENKYGFKDYPDYVYNLGEWLSDSPIGKLLDWVHSKKSRKTYIKIDHYDIWDMDTTLSHIILPMLKRLKAVKHGVPVISDPDVLELLSKEIDEIRQAENIDDDTDLKINEVVWDFILDEMIWAFEQKLIDWLPQYYYTGEDGLHCLDMDGYTKHNDRMNRGFAYFGRYYQALWD
jgi:hypothetical protein